MNGYLNKLALSSMGQPQSIRPRLASLFEPVGGLRVLSFKTTGAGAEKRPQNALPRLDEPNAETGEVKAAPVSSSKRSANVDASDNSPSIASSAVEIPSQLTRVSSPGKSSVEGFSPTPRPVLSDEVSTKPSRSEGVTALEIFTETVQPPQRVDAIKQDSPIRDQPNPEIQVARVIETSVIESLVQSDSQSSSTRDTSRIRPEPVTNSVIVKPEVTAGLKPTPSIKAELPEASSAIRITIGRVDVRAIMPAPPPATAVAPMSQRKGNSAQSLDEYLKTRNGD